MEVEIKFKSIAWQWFLNIFLVIILFVVIVEILICSYIRVIYVDRIRSLSTEYTQVFSTLAATPKEKFRSSAFEYAEKFEYKNKMEVQILDSNGEVFVSTSGFTPEKSDFGDYEAATKSNTGTANVEAKTELGEPVLCGTVVLADYGNGSNGAYRWIVSLEQTNKVVWIQRSIFISVGILILAFAAVSGIFFIKSIVKPIRAVSASARKIAMGEFDTQVITTKTNEIGELCDSINYMANELKRAENMKNDFISSVSHELRTPLTAIRGWGETAKMSIGVDESIVEKGLDVVLKETGRLSSLVEELLDFSRIQSGRLTVNMCPLKVSELLEEVANMYTELASQQSVSLTYTKPKYDSEIMGDRDRLKQVFINVIDNAVKYTEAGGQVLIEQYEEDGCVRVTVKDTGVGIPEQDIDRVKEKFYKSNKTVRGSGIGLAVADEIIKQHSGLLFIASTEGVGTTVTIALPIYEKPEDTTEIILAPDESEGKEETNG